MVRHGAQTLKANKLCRPHKMLTCAGRFLALATDRDLYRRPQHAGNTLGRHGSGTRSATREKQFTHNMCSTTSHRVGATQLYTKQVKHRTPCARDTTLPQPTHASIPTTQQPAFTWQCVSGSRLHARNKRGLVWPQGSKQHAFAALVNYAQSHSHASPWVLLTRMHRSWHACIPAGTHAPCTQFGSTDMHCCLAWDTTATRPVAATLKCTQKTYPASLTQERTWTPGYYRAAPVSAGGRPAQSMQGRTSDSAVGCSPSELQR
jgi:hypothetical protein